MTEYREHYPNVNEHLPNHTNYSYNKSDSTSDCLTSSVLSAANLNFLDTQHSVTQIESNLLEQINDDKPTNNQDDNINVIKENDTTLPIQSENVEPVPDEHPINHVDSSVECTNSTMENESDQLMNIEMETTDDQLNPLRNDSELIVPEKPSIEIVLPEFDNAKDDLIDDGCPDDEENQIDDNASINSPINDHLINGSESSFTNSEPETDPSEFEAYSKPRKKRKRIVSLNDDDNESEDENNARRNILKMTSPSPSEKSTDPADILENIVQNEKPGPKSKKISTKLMKEIQARELLRRAVVIPAAECDSKKKRPRMIDSDDDDDDNDVENCTNFIGLDDIGASDGTVEQSIETVDPSTLLNEDDDELNPLDDDEDNFIDEKCDEMIVPIENPILPDHCNDMNDDYNDNNDDNDHYNDDNDNDDPVNSNIMSTSANECITDSTTDFNKEIKKENSDNNDDHDTKSNILSKATIKNEVEKVQHRKIKEEKKSKSNTKQHNDFSVFQESFSSEEEEFIPNDIYFGSPDRAFLSTYRGRGRPRGRPRINTSLPRNHNDMVKQSKPTPPQRSRGSGGGGGGGGGGRGRGRPPMNHHRFIDNRSYSSKSSESDSSDSDGTSSESDAISNNKKYHKSKMRSSTQYNVSSSGGKKKKDRFYDKSRSIPNEIYFGDVQVPLHVLHSYGDSSNSESEMDKLARYHQQPKTKHQTPTYHKSTTPGKRGRPPGRPKTIDTSGSSNLKQLKKFLKAAGIKKVKYSKLWHGCTGKREKAARILELLREKGLQGEPTLAKCKQLKEEIQAKKEIEELDPNLILPTEGRTRRSARSTSARRHYSYDDEEAAAAATTNQPQNTKWKKVIDSDSDFD